MKYFPPSPPCTVISGISVIVLIPLPVGISYDGSKLQIYKSPPDLPFLSVDVLLVVYRPPAPPDGILNTNFLDQRLLSCISS